MYISRTQYQFHQHDVIYQHDIQNRSRPEAMVYCFIPSRSCELQRQTIVVATYCPWCLKYNLITLKKSISGFIYSSGDKQFSIKLESFLKKFNLI